MLILIIYIIGLAGLAIQMADSELANTIKKLLRIDYERNILIALATPTQYYKVLPNWVGYTIIITILIYILSLIAYLIRMVIRLLNCPVCISFWLGFFFFSTNYSTIEAIVMGGATTVMTMIIDKYTL